MLFPDKTKFKIEYSDEIMDLIIKLLDKDRSTRLGSNGGAKEILSHPLFKKYDTKKIYNKTMEPPFMPEIDKSNEMQFFNMDKGQEAMMDTMIP